MQNGQPGKVLKSRQLQEAFFIPALFGYVSLRPTKGTQLGLTNDSRIRSVNALPGGSGHLLSPLNTLYRARPNT